MMHQKMTAITALEHSVEIKAVSKTFGSFHAVNNVSLPIHTGEFVTLLGPSGCGKTTLLNMVAGFIDPSAGAIHIGGVDVTDVPVHLRDTGMVFQSYALFPHMNVFDNVAFGLRQRKFSKSEVTHKVMQTIEMMKLSGMEGRRISQLSGGQQQRVALARAIAIQPKVLLLDEPLSALDKSLRAQMQVELIEMHRNTGLTTIFVTHDQGEALSLSDRIVVMNRGQIQQVAEPIDLYRNPANGFVASFIGEINALPAAIYQASDREISLAIGNIRMTAPRRAEWQFGQGEMVQAFVRPEHIRIATSADAGCNVVTGEVLTHIYQGSHTITRLRVDGLGPIEMRLPGGDVVGRVPVGMPTQIAFDLSQVILLADKSS
ncbi:Spermidine/putrescine import ATP-binding protein PotA (plasmid) [Aminobacter niigataensis]|nr:Spermidine/putrescine import ATP-binding protein PotA [Aminobacter niigataensis]